MSPPSKPTAKGIRSNVIVTERVIEIESKKRPQVSAHSDNISATEYFTKGDVQVEIPVEDESPIDSYEVKISNVEPEEFDWEKLPISPLRERKIVVESKERVVPVRDKEIIIIEREEQGITIDVALNSGYINYETKDFTHPVTKETVSVEQAIKKGYIQSSETEANAAIEAFKRKGSVMEYKNTKDVEYVRDDLNNGMSFKEAIECNQIDTQAGTVKHPGSLVTFSLADAIASNQIDGDSAWFTSPSSKRLFSISEAIANNVMDSHGYWCSQLSGLKKSFAEGLTQGYIKLLTPDDQTRCILTIVKKFAVHDVIHPVSMEHIDYNVAVLEGVVNTVEGVYKSPATGDALLIDDAIAKGLIRGALLSTRTNRELLPNEPVVTEKKCYTITHAKDTSSGKNLTINEARGKGILDEDLTTFTDMTNGTRFVSTKVHRIASVVNPRTKQEIPANQAVKEGIIDEETGDYVNLDDEKINMSNAIEKGLIKTRPTPTPVNNVPSFSITAITNPNNGELMTVTDALRHGFLDRGRKHFFNPSTQAVCSLIEAINNGWVHVKSNTDTRGLSPYGQLQPPSSSYAQQTFTILSVRNVKLGEEVSVATAISQGLLDSSKQRYRNNMSGEVLSLDQAIKQNLITLVPTGYTSTKTASVTQPAYPTMRALSTPSTPTLQSRRRHPSQNSPAVLLPTTTIAAASHPNASIAEPVYTQIRKDHTRHRSGPNQSSTQPEAIDLYKANARGLISHAKGEVTVPQYGVTMLVDDALIQGFVTIGIPINMLSSRPFDPSSFAIFEAFKRGFVNPVTLSVRHPATGQFMSMESALTSGLLQPRASTNSSPTHPTLKQNSLHTKKVRRSESLGRAETDRRRVQRNASLHTSTKQHTQSQEYHNYGQPLLTPHSHYQSIKPSRVGLSLGHGSGSMTLTTNRSGSHLVNGKLYSSKAGHIINSNGQVVNLSDGEVMSLAQAERLGVVQRLVDNDSHLAQSYVPAANMMFNRDPVSFSPKAEDNGVTVVHIRHHRSSDDSLGSDGLYSTLPNNQPVNGSNTLPPRLHQLNDHYAEIRH
ncbi:uncharacterized protein [Watersipora subatra]|uniref:uncharacterized protein isoform X3 n=1 Tax=Watersipora subatra TaxID=2589382 RepID=UPI00355AF804